MEQTDNKNQGQRVPRVDPVMDQLVFLSRLHGRPVSAQQILGSVPLPDGRVTIRELEECAERAGLSILPVEGDPASIMPGMLPLLLISESGKTLSVLQRKGDQFEIRLPGFSGTLWVPSAQLAGQGERYNWFVARPLLYIDERTLIYETVDHKHWFWDTLRANSWIYGWALLGTAVINLFGAVIPFFTMAVYDRVVPNHSMDSLRVLFIAVLAVVIMDFFTKLMRSYLVDSAARKADIALSSKIFAQSLKIRSELRPASGGILANIIRDFESVREFFASSTLTLLGDMPFMLLYLGIIALIGGWLVLIPIALIPLALGTAWLLRKPMQKVLDETIQESSQRTALLFEVMNGLDTVKSLAADSWARRKWEALTVRISENSVKLREITSFGNYVSSSLASLTTVMLVTFGAILIIDGDITMGQLIAVSMLSGRAIAPVAQLAGIIIRWQQTKLSLKALNQIMAAPIDEMQDSLYLPSFEGKLELRDVKFAYPQAAPVLKGINLKIAAGEKIAFIGRIGSGKSTVLKMVLNIYRATEGNILVDSIANTQIDPYCLRRNIGYVPQDVILFHGDIRENILMGATDISDEDIVRAVKLAGMEETLAQLPNGLGTQVGERGEKLSGGQRQTIAVARALVRNPTILLLDEPSSAMDPATEQKLIANLRSLKDTTMILVTHRTAMLPLVDRLVVFSNGQIVMDGPRDEVMRMMGQQAAQQRNRAPGAPPVRTTSTAPVAGAATPAAAMATVAQGANRPINPAASARPNMAPTATPQRPANPPQPDSRPATAGITTARPGVANPASNATRGTGNLPPAPPPARPAVAPRASSLADAPTMQVKRPAVAPTATPTANRGTVPQAPTPQPGGPRK